MTLNYLLIGKRIKTARKAKGYSQAELSEIIDLSAGYMSYIETGSKKPSLETLMGIANALEVTVDELLFDSMSSDHAIASLEVEKILSDCSAYERAVIIDSAQAIKESLRTSKHLLAINPDFNYTDY